MAVFLWSSILHALVASNLPAIREICRKRRVRSLEVFGSGATDRAREPADFDFLVEFLEPREHPAANYFGLVGDLEALLGKKVDLVVNKAIKNPFFWKSIDRDRTPVYAD